MPRGTMARLACGSLVLFAPAPALAQSDSFHFMQIEQVIGGVNGDTSAQSVQLRMRSVGQNFIAGTALVAYDAQGQNAVTLITFPGNVAQASTGSRILVATASFPSPVQPDFTMTNGIPPSYLAAGWITFEAFGVVYWSRAWGGGAYTGSTTGDITNDADGQFGPPWAGPLPSGSLQALRFTGPAAPPARATPRTTPSPRAPRRSPTMRAAAAS
jgi:hypothetical protein